MENNIQKWLNFLDQCNQEDGIQKNAALSKKQQIRFFLNWIDKDVREIKKEDIRNYIYYLNAYESLVTGKPFAKNTKKQYLRSIRYFFQKLILHEKILTNPMEVYSRINCQGYEKIRVVLSEEEVAQFLESIDGFERLKYRAIFELMYACALRRSEVGALKVADVDVKDRILIVRSSKFGKDRMVPITEVAMVWLVQMLEGKTAEERVFPKIAQGHLIGVWFMRFAKESGIWRNGLSSHSLRHSCAVHLLGRGADLRYVQELLGHESLDSTVRYTKELTANIKKIYKRYHPREGILYKEINECYVAKVYKLSQDSQKAWAHRVKARQRGWK